MAERLSVELDAEASPVEVAAVEAAFREAGIEVSASAKWRKPPGVGNGAFWIILVTLGVPVGAFLKSYGESLGTKAGEATWEAFKRLVDGLREARQGSTLAADGWVEFDDPEGTKLMIAAIPDEAFEALLELEWSEHSGGMLMWDENNREWFDPNRKYGSE